ncbi:MAG: hypothetical protein V8R90_11510 [Eubacterium sp.]
MEKSHQKFDEDEDISLEIYTIDELMEKIIANEINDAKTVSSLLTYYCKYVKGDCKK